MKAAQLYEIGQKLRICDVPEPKTGPRDVLVDVKASGVCHSDLHYRNGVSPVGKLPITLGHEIAGVIAKVGDEVRGVREGNRVCVHYLITCGSCAFCTSAREYFCESGKMIGKHVDGGFAEYVRVPERSIVSLPEEIPFDQGAILGCAVATPFHALRKAKIDVGDTVAVYGIGGIGIHAVQLAARLFGAGMVIAVDISNSKLEAAGEVGADEAVNAAEEDPVEAIKGLTYGRMANVVVEAVGLRKTIEQAIDSAGKGGRVMLVGIGGESVQFRPYDRIILNELEVIGSSDHSKSEMFTITKLTKAGRIDLLRSITHRVSLDEVNEGMNIIEEGTENALRVVATQ